MFSKKNSKPPPARERLKALRSALLRNQTTENSLAKRVDGLQRLIASDTQRARQVASTHPAVARSLLQRRAGNQSQESVLSKQLRAVQQRRAQLELAVSTTEVVESAAETHRALMTARAETAVDRVGDLMDDVGDLMEHENELAEVAAQGADVGPVVDIDEELRSMQAEGLPSVDETYEENTNPILLSTSLAEPTQTKHNTHARTPSAGNADDLERMVSWANAM